MTGAAKEKSLSASLAAARVLLLLAVALFLGETRVWAFAAPPQPASGQIALVTPSSVGEITTAWHYDASDSLLAAKRIGGKPPFKGKPGETVRGDRQSRTYGKDGYPKTDRDSPHTPSKKNPWHDKDHSHDWEPGGKNRGPAREPRPGDPPKP